MKFRAQYILRQHNNRMVISCPDQSYHSTMFFFNRGTSITRMWLIKKCALGLELSKMTHDTIFLSYMQDTAADDFHEVWGRCSPPFAANVPPSANLSVLRHLT